MIRKKVAEEIARDCGNAKSLLLLDYSRLKGNQAVEIRSLLRQSGVSAAVVKNSTARHAFEKLGRPELAQYLSGMTLLVYGDQPDVLAKKVHEFKKKQNVLDVKCGYLDGKLLTSEDVKKISELPSREQLLAQVVGTTAMPLNCLVWDLNAILQQLLRAIDGISRKSASEGGGAPQPA